MTRLSDAFEWAWADAHDLIDLTDGDGVRAWIVRGMIARGLPLWLAQRWADDVLRCVLEDPFRPSNGVACAG